MAETSMEALVPRVRFSWDFNIGHVVTIATVIIGLVAGYTTLVTRVDASATAITKIPVVEARVTANEQDIELIRQDISNDRSVRLNFQSQMVDALKSIEEDRKDQQAVNSEVLQKLAGIIARLDERAGSTQ